MKDRRASLGASTNNLDPVPMMLLFGRSVAFFFPPPQAFAGTLVSTNDPCAWLTTDKSIPGDVQFIVRNRIVSNVTPDPI